LRSTKKRKGLPKEAPHPEAGGRRGIGFRLCIAMQNVNKFFSPDRISLQSFSFCNTTILSCLITRFELPAENRAELRTGFAPTGMHPEPNLQPPNWGILLRRFRGVSLWWLMHQDNLPKRLQTNVHREKMPKLGRASAIRLRFDQNLRRYRLTRSLGEVRRNMKRKKMLKILRKTSLEFAVVLVSIHETFDDHQPIKEHQVVESNLSSRAVRRFRI